VRGRRWLGAGLALLSGFALYQRSVAAEPTAPRPASLKEPRGARTLTMLRFERNRGQFDSAVEYLARGPSYSLRLQAGQATLALTHEGAAAEVTMSVVGGAAVQALPSEQLAGVSNYFVGDESRWRTGVEGYARVLYPGVLPGVDIAYYGTQGRELEYDLLLGPGVEARGIELELAGVAAVEIDARGAALLRLQGGGTVEQHAPVAYQLDDAGQRVPVSVAYELRGPTRLGFRIGPHDASRRLVIDPVLSYSTYLGGQRFDQLHAVATDTSGNTYAVGYTGGSLWPAANPVQSTYGGGAQDAVVVKLNPAGNDLVYSTYLGGSSADQANAIAVDAQGNAHVTGVTLSPNFPLANPFQGTRPGGLDAFVTKLNTDGSAILYSTYLGGAFDDTGFGIATGPGSTVFVTGTTNSPGFPLQSALRSTYGGNGDAFLTRVGPTGGTLTFSTFLGGSGLDLGNAVVATSTGDVLVVGNTASNNFPVLNAFQPTYQGGTRDAFLLRVDATGTTLAYST
jgi:hypothetical protein